MDASGSPSSSSTVRFGSRSSDPRRSGNFEQQSLQNTGRVTTTRTRRPGQDLLGHHQFVRHGASADRHGVHRAGEQPGSARHEPGQGVVGAPVETQLPGEPRPRAHRAVRSAPPALAAACSLRWSNRSRRLLRGRPSCATARARQQGHRSSERVTGRKPLPDDRRTPEPPPYTGVIDRCAGLRPAVSQEERAEMPRRGFAGEVKGRSGRGRSIRSRSASVTPAGQIRS